MRSLFALLLLCLFALPATAHDETVGSLEIEHPWARATIGNLRMTAGYLVIENKGAEAERLLGAESPLAEKIELHTVEDGAMKMVESIEIPPGGSVTFAPGGYHLMIGPLTGPLNEGDNLPGTLIFEQAGRVEVQFLVEPANATESHGHH